MRARERVRMTAGPLRNRHGGLEVSSKEVTRNGVILPPIGDALVSSTSLVVGGSEGGRTGRTGRHLHNGTTKKKKNHSSTTVVATVAGTQNVPGTRCEAEGNSPGGTITSKGDPIIAVCSAVSAAPSTSLHGDDGHRDSANVRGVTTAGGNGQQEYLSSSDEDRGRGATGHGNSPVACARDATNKELVDEMMEVKGEIMETETDHVPGGIVMETSGGAHTDLHISGRTKKSNIGREEGRRGPNSPVAAMRARVDDALRNLLTLGSESQASPASASPPRTSTSTSSTPGQPGTRGLSPLSWSRLKPGRRTKEPKLVFFGGNEDKGLDNGDGDSNKKPGLIANEGPATNGSVLNAACRNNVIPPAIDGDMSIRNRHEDEQPGVAESTASRGLVVGNAVGRQKRVSETDETSHHGSSVDHDKVATGAESKVAKEKMIVAEAVKPHRLLARDKTLVHRDVWPDLLDNEADPHEWSLDKGEDEVLAAARSMGSVLVRVVTWNLHAKPTPAADKLREALLPPGKVIGYNGHTGVLHLSARCSCIYTYIPGVSVSLFSL